MKLPLAFDPGEAYCYGGSIDWVCPSPATQVPRTVPLSIAHQLTQAGILIERLTGVASLGEYLQFNIFAPLSMFSTTFKPRRSAAIMSRLVEISQRDEEGGWKPDIVAQWLDFSEKAEFESGGFGLWSTAGDFLAFLRAMLNGGEGIFKMKKTWEVMFQPQFAGDDWLQAHEHLPSISRTGGNLLFSEMKVNMALGVMLMTEDSPVGCKAGTAQAGGSKKYTSPAIFPSLVSTHY